MALESTPIANFGKLVQVQEGKIERYYQRKDGKCVVFTVCCDCGLTHLEEFLPKKGYIRVRVWRDDTRTKEMHKSRRERSKKKNARKQNKASKKAF